MLILTRRIGESIIIGDNIIVKFLGKNSYGEIRIGIEAPKETPINREEVYIKMQEKLESDDIET